MESSTTTAPRLMTYRDVAEAMQISERSVFTLAKSGALPAVRVSAATIRFDPADVAAFIAARKGAGHA